MEVKKGYLMNSSQIMMKRNVTPARIWPVYYSDDFLSDNQIVGTGNFGTVFIKKFKTKTYLLDHQRSSMYADQQVALKDPKGEKHDWLEEQYALSHEVSCTVILHPNIVNYIGGVELRSPQRIGIVMELMSTDLRSGIKRDIKLKDRKNQLLIAKQISSGMNFLHSLNPYILHRDLRTPNILINENLECKIADFGISNNIIYEGFKSIAMYTELIPPECLNNQNNFTKKGDVYFYGWILIELVFGTQIENYNFDEHKSEIENKLNEKKDLLLKELIFICLNKNAQERPYFSQILYKINSILEIKYDLELIAQNNLMDILKEGLENFEITSNSCDSLGRNLIHQACIFGNLPLMEYLEHLWGELYFSLADSFKITLTHYAARNGYFHILKFLHSKGALSNKKDSRYQISALSLAISMRHTECIDFLLPFSNQDNLNKALISTCSEGNLELVKKLVSQGADLTYRSEDIGSSPLDRACYSGHLEVAAFLISKGCSINQTRPNGSTSLYVASENGHRDIVKLLLEKGADANLARTDTSTTPLFMSCQEGHKEIAKLLLEYGANPHIVRNNDGCTPLFCAAQHNHKKIVEILLKHGVNVNQALYDGGTSLTIASFFGFKEIVALLLKYKADVTRKALGRFTALDNAKNKGYVEIVEMLENHIQSLQEN